MGEKVSAQAVQQYHYFGDLSAQDAAIAASKLETIHVGAGETLFSQGDIGAWVYLLVAGEMEIKVQVSEDEDRTLCVLEPPALMGEMSLLLDEPRTASAIARTDCQVWQFSRDEFHRATQSGDRWANQFLLVMSKILASRLADMNHQLVTLIADKQDQSAARPVKVDELEELRNRLFTQWSF